MFRFYYQPLVVDFFVVAFKKKKLLTIPLENSGLLSKEYKSSDSVFEMGFLKSVIFGW